MSMIDKTWLIRTKQHQILGPISKVKVIELLEKSSLLDDDELSSGNGYWFQIKETELMSKYIYGDIIQSFNPISEAPNVLTLTPDTKSQTASIKPATLPRDIENTEVIEEKEEDDLLPEDLDLEYPDMDIDDNTIVTKIPVEFLGSNNTAQNIKSSNDKIQDIKKSAIEIISNDEDNIIPEEEDLEYPDMGEASNTSLASESSSQSSSSLSAEAHAGPTPSNGEAEVAEEADIPVHVEAKTPVHAEAETPVHEKASKKKKNNKTYIGLILLVLILGVIFFGINYYYTKILNKPFPLFSSNYAELIMSEASANNQYESIIKKKVVKIRQL